MVETKMYGERGLEPEREERFKVVKSEIDEFFKKDRDANQLRDLNLAVKYLIKYFEYAAVERQLGTELSHAQSEDKKIDPKKLKHRRKIVTLDDDISHNRKNRPGFKSEYDYLFPRVIKISQLFVVNPQTKSSGFGESKVALFLKTYI